MNKIIKYVGIISMLLLFIPMVFAVQPAQQFNKIFLDPFYRQSMNAQDYTYELNINPPDGFNNVISAIVTFQMWLNPTIEFFLLVDGQQCNTPSYEVHTTYAGAGEGTIYFDCSNIITEAGTYTITLTPDDDTGAVTGWVDMTYTNDPTGDFELQGTEYSPGDPGTIFLQLKDAQGSPVNNGACYLDIYSPLVNGTHPYFLEDAPMIFDSNDDGIYYYDIHVPEILGNYMLSAKCSYSYQTPLWVYGPFSQDVASEVRIANGDWDGNAVALNDKADTLYEKCISTSGTNGCLTEWIWQLPAGDYASNESIINVYYSGQADRERLVHFSCLNITGGNYVDFDNQLTYSGHASGTLATQVDDFLTNILPRACVNETQSEPNVTIRYYANTNGLVIYHNWLSLLVLASSGNVQDLKGSSEMHVTNQARESALLTAPQVWNYTNRELNNITNIIESVWNNSNRTLTDYQEQLISDTVWNNSNRTLTDYQEQLISNAVWSNINRTLTDYETANMALSIWTYSNRTLTDYQITNIVNQMWIYNNRTLTDYQEQLISDTIWTDIDRTLTNATNIADDIAGGVWGWVNPISNNLLAQIVYEVWEYTAGRYINGEII